MLGSVKDCQGSIDTVLKYAFVHDSRNKKGLINLSSCIRKHYNVIVVNQAQKTPIVLRDLIF